MRARAGLPWPEFRIFRYSLSRVFRYSLKGKAVHHRPSVSRQPWNQPIFPLHTRHPICMTLVDERQVLARDVTSRQAEILAYDLIRGANEKRSNMWFVETEDALVQYEYFPPYILVRWNSVVCKPTDIPTTVLLHGILGSRKNWGISRLYSASFESVSMLKTSLK